MLSQLRDFLAGLESPSLQVNKTPYISMAVTQNCIFDKYKIKLFEELFKTIFVKTTSGI